MTSIISFPGLGIEGFSVNTVAFSLFGRNITWYGIIITLGIIAAVALAFLRSKKEGVVADDILDLAIYCVIFGVIGARLYYVIMKRENFNSFYDVIAIWNGGLAIYGGIIAGFLAGFVVTKIKKMNVRKLFDVGAPSVMLGQIIGRWGNFVNAEAYGSETTLPWRMGIQNIYNPNTIYVHPTFLYESLWNLIGFILINIFYNKKKFDGEVFLWYVSWYGFGRMFIEGLRTDSLYVGPVRISQLVAILSCAACVALIILFRYKSRGNPNAVAKYAYLYQSDENPEIVTSGAEKPSRDKNKTAAGKPKTSETIGDSAEKSDDESEEKPDEKPDQIVSEDKADIKDDEKRDDEEKEESE
ncbi:MAG: prolipoprotein diacylglyceryl transferase [Eubacteriales bacterium]|jgi:phosphatidylglycerol:prolipoprotein diacylglycerol transferase